MSEKAVTHDAIAGDIVHEYDGIQEADNHLPRWWLATFFGAMAFGLAYWFIYCEFEMLPQPLAAYMEEQAQAAASGPALTDDQLVALAQNPDLRAQGSTVFHQNCIACHGEHAEGKIGPNLTDEFWIHGGEPTHIVHTITTGVGAKGMPAWGPVLGPGGVRSVVAYVLSLRNTHVAGKAPEGERYSP